MENYSLPKTGSRSFLAPAIAIVIVYFGLNFVSLFNFTGKLERIAKEQGVVAARQKAEDKIASYDNILEELLAWGPKAASERYLENTKP